MSRYTPDRVRSATCALLLALAAPCASADQRSAAANDCAAEIDAVHSMVQTQRVTVTSSAGWSRETVRRVRWRREADGTLSTRVGIVAPRRDAGLEVLIVAARGAPAEVHVYTPDTGRVRRLTGAGASASALGADLSIEDVQAIERLIRASWSAPVAEATRDGRRVVVLESTAADVHPGYARIRAYVDRRWCVPLRVEFYAAGGVLEKTLHSPPAQVALVDGHRVPLETRVRHHRLGTRTTIALSEVALDTALPARLFTPQALEQGE